ncbi:MAG: tRNA 2-thiouridine(34) synthase MnmA [Gammaproteobacteria bacterium]|nr:tRNA 2-thiouridine(34) synthase MnmA [Gammaproteobacteria bacterium]
MRAHSRSRVIVGLSGGVDSAVAALLLQEQGYAVEGLFMDNWEDGEDQTYCTAARDFQDSRQVCDQLDIPLHKVNFAAQYREHVFKYFLEEYAAGRTPNPDVLCNSEIKFKAFLDYALRLGADYIATGHYARTRHTAAGVKLLRARDSGKDQSYFLHAVPQPALADTLFPIGGLFKSEVRRRARAAGFANHAKKDSTGICFIGERRFAAFLAKYLPACPGNIETPEGEVLGSHQGLMYYTFGQRQGLGIGGRRDRDETPWYVAGKNLERNVLVVVQGHDHPQLLRNALLAGGLHWIAGAPPAMVFDCTAKSRYRQPDQSCRVRILDDQCCHVEFAESQWALTPGQYVVFYQRDECLGGGVIQSVLTVTSPDVREFRLPVRSPA